MKTLSQLLLERQHAIVGDGWICVEDTLAEAEIHAQRSRREMAHFDPPVVLEVVPTEILVAAYRALREVVAEGRCAHDVLNPCRPVDGKHWGGGPACAHCRAAAALGGAR